MIKSAARQSAHYYKPFVVSSLGVLIPLWILSELADQYFALGAKLAERGSPEQWMAQLWQLCTAVVVSFVLILLLPVRMDDLIKGRKPLRSWVKVANQQGWPLFVEGLRMTAYVILWSLLLILPGIYKQIRYLFVPFVVLLDPQYQQGKVDALERSSLLTVGVFWWLVLLFAMSFGLELGFEMLGQLHPALTHPTARVLTGGLSMLASIYFYIWFFFIYEARSKQLQSSC